MYDDEDIDIISSFLYDSYVYDEEEEESYDDESEEDSEDYYYYSYN